MIFKAGDNVKCINDNFPYQHQHGGDPSLCKDQPKLNELLEVEDVLGEYLMFEKYNSPISNNFWHESRFEKAKSIKEQTNEMLTHICEQAYYTK